MANPYPANFTDDSGTVREAGAITFTDAGNQPGGSFNGGTITEGLTVAPSADEKLLDLTANAAQNEDIATIENVNAAQVFRLDAFDNFTFTLTDQGGDFRVLGAGTNNLTITNNGINLQAAAAKFVQMNCATHGSVLVDASGISLRDGTDMTHVQVDGTGVGFFGTAPAAQPTGVAVSAAGIHAALVSLGLITA